MSRACCCSNPGCRLYGCAQDRQDRIDYPAPYVPPVPLPVVPGPFAPMPTAPIPTGSGWLCPACGSAHPPSVTTCPNSLRVTTGNAATLTVPASGTGE